MRSIPYPLKSSADPKLARRMIEHLGDLLRLSLNSQGVHEISLAEELSFLDHYLAIQMIRFGDSLKVEKRIAPDVMHALVPQPLHTAAGGKRHTSRHFQEGSWWLDCSKRATGRREARHSST